MKCDICKQKLKDGESVMPIHRFVTNEKRGDFVHTTPTAWAHQECVSDPQGAIMRYTAQQEHRRLRRLAREDMGD